MSTCISKHGEYSEHGPLTDGYWCEWCGALDEAAMRKGIESAVREQVARDIEDRFAPVLAVAGVVRVAIRLCIAIVRGDATDICAGEA